MLKSIFWFLFGTGITVVFAGGMLFIFGQSQRVVCRHVEPTVVNCTVSNVLLNTVPLPGFSVNNVVGAEVQEDCDDGCSYRTALISQGGTRRPISEVWTDQQAQDDAMAQQINDFVRSPSQPSLVIDLPLIGWLIAMLGGMALISILIQAMVLATNLGRALLGPRAPLGRGY